MKRPLILACLAALALPLAACADDGYYRPRPDLVARPWYAWYDGFYGPIYDGYWGGDGFFYFRLGAGERGWRRGDRQHFRRDEGPPQGNFHRFDGTLHAPPPVIEPPRMQPPRVQPPRMNQPRVPHRRPPRIEGERHQRHPQQP